MRPSLLLDLKRSAIREAASRFRTANPCIRGLRIAVQDILDWLASGMSADDIVHDFPELTKDDVLACQAYTVDNGRHAAWMRTVATDPAAYDAWFRAKVKKALDDPRPAIPHDQVEAHFAKQRKAVLRKAGKSEA